MDTNDFFYQNLTPSERQEHDRLAEQQHAAARRELNHQDARVAHHPIAGSPLLVNLPLPDQDDDETVADLEQGSGLEYDDGQLQAMNQLGNLVEQAGELLVEAATVNDEAGLFYNDDHLLEDRGESLRQAGRETQRLAKQLLARLNLATADPDPDTGHDLAADDAQQQGR